MRTKAYAVAADVGEEGKMMGSPRRVISDVINLPNSTQEEAMMLDAVAWPAKPKPGSGAGRMLPTRSPLQALRSHLPQRSPLEVLRRNLPVMSVGKLPTGSPLALAKKISRNVSRRHRRHKRKLAKKGPYTVSVPYSEDFCYVQDESNCSSFLREVLRLQFYPLLLTFAWAMLPFDPPAKGYFRNAGAHVGLAVGVGVLLLAVPAWLCWQADVPDPRPAHQAGAALCGAFAFAVCHFLAVTFGAGEGFGGAELYPFPFGAFLFAVPACVPTLVFTWCKGITHGDREYLLTDRHAWRRLKTAWLALFVLVLAFFSFAGLTLAFWFVADAEPALTWVNGDAELTRVLLQCGLVLAFFAVRRAFCDLVLMMTFHYLDEDGAAPAGTIVVYMFCVFWGVSLPRADYFSASEFLFIELLTTWYVPKKLLKRRLARIIKPFDIPDEDSSDSEGAVPFPDTRQLAQRAAALRPMTIRRARPGSERRVRRAGADYMDRLFSDSFLNSHARQMNYRAQRLLLTQMTCYMAHLQFLLFFLFLHLGHNKRYFLTVCDIWNSGATTDDQFLFSLYWLTAHISCQFCATWNLHKRLSKWLRIHTRPLIDFVLQVYGPSMIKMHAFVLTALALLLLEHAGNDLKMGFGYLYTGSEEFTRGRFGWYAEENYKASSFVNASVQLEYVIALLLRRSCSIFSFVC